MTTGYIVLVFLAIALFAISPFLSAILSSIIGKWLGCNINEAGTDHGLALFADDANWVTAGYRFYGLLADVVGWSGRQCKGKSFNSSSCCLCYKAHYFC